MVMKRDLVIAVLCTFCLTSALLTILPAGSNNKTSSIGEYDPWIDSNDDGIIDYLDISMAARAFGTTGTPINKTALLLELQARIDSLNATNLELQSKVDLLNASLLESQNTIDELNSTILGLQSQIDTLNNTTLELQSRFDGLNASLLESQSRIDDLNASLTSQINVLITQMATMNMTINELRTDIAVLNATKLGKPDFDSGWTPINQGQHIVLNHNLGTTNLLVYMIGYDITSVNYIHQINYGGDSTITWSGGAWWSELTTSTVRVDRKGNDGVWQYVRVMIWKILQS